MKINKNEMDEAVQYAVTLATTMCDYMSDDVHAVSIPDGWEEKYG